MISNSTNPPDPATASLKLLDLIHQIRYCLLNAANSSNYSTLYDARSPLWIIYQDISEILESQRPTQERPTRPPENLTHNWENQASFQQSTMPQPARTLQPVLSPEGFRNNQGRTELEPSIFNIFRRSPPRRPKRIHFVPLLANTTLEAAFADVLRKSSGVEFEYTIGKQIEAGVPNIFLCEYVTRLEDASLKLMKESAIKQKLLLYLANDSFKLPQRNSTQMIDDEVIKTTYIAFSTESGIKFKSMHELKAICLNYLKDIGSN